MHEWVDKLLAVQERDLRIEKLEEQIQSVPGDKAEAQAILAQSELAVAEARKALQEGEKQLKSFETQADSLDAKRRDFQSKSIMIKSNEEYKTALHQIELCSKQIAEIEDRQLEVMERIEEAKQRVQEKKREQQATAERVANMIADLDTRLERSLEQVEKLRATRDDGLVGVDPDVVSRYERLRSSRRNQHGDPRVLVCVRDDVCDRCRMNVTAQLRNEARKGLPVTCQNCGALLYHE